jgi:hypothetical protein
MTNESPSSQERIAPDQHVAPGQYVTAPAHLDGSWERVGRKAVATLLEDALDDLTMETELTVGDVRRGETVTIDHVSRLRRTLDALEAAVEWHLAELAENAEPWEIDMDDGTDYERPRFTSTLCSRCGRGVGDEPERGVADSVERRE